MARILLRICNSSKHLSNCRLWLMANGSAPPVTQSRKGVILPVTEGMLWGGSSEAATSSDPSSCTMGGFGTFTVKFYLFGIGVVVSQYFWHNWLWLLNLKADSCFCVDTEFTPRPTQLACAVIEHLHLCVICVAMSCMSGYGTGYTPVP